MSWSLGAHVKYSILCENIDDYIALYTLLCGLLRRVCICIGFVCTECTLDGWLNITSFMCYFTFLHVEVKSRIYLLRGSEFNTNCLLSSVCARLAALPPVRCYSFAYPERYKAKLTTWQVVNITISYLNGLYASRSAWECWCDMVWEIIEHGIEPQPFDTDASQSAATPTEGS